MALGPLAHADDHGDDRASATDVELPSETAGEIDPGDDEDWFRFEVAASGGVNAESAGDLDTVGTLYDADGNRLATNDTGSPGHVYYPNFRIRRMLDAGTYYFRVTSAGDATGSYVLRLRRTVDVHGNTLQDATRVALPSETASAIDPRNDADWFAFEATASGELTAETTGGLDTVGWLYANDGTQHGDQLAHDDNSGAGLNFRIQHQLYAGTSYYVEVKSIGGTTGSYALRLRFEASGDTTADDHGDDRASATYVELPSETAGEIDPGSDADWFRFEVATSGEVTAETSGDLDTVGALYDSAGNMLATNDASGNWNFRIQQTLDAGTYYVRVTSFGSRTGSYALRLGFENDGDVTTTTVPAGGHLRNLGDFNGDGKADVLLRHADGRWHYYPMDGATVLAGSGSASLTRDLAWRIAGVGDFDGDGKDDVLLRKTDGRWFFYPMDGRSVLAGRGTVRMTRDLAWQVAGIGDLDGDGRDDVLMRHEDGRWHYYRMNGRRPLAGSGSGRLTRDLNWQMAGIGDFDGDGKDDVLLRRRDDGRWYSYPMNGRASIAGPGTVPLTRDLAWAVAGVGDFDADGRHDVLLRHADGRWRYYPMQGRRVLEGAGLVNLADDTSTTVAGIGDLNGDGRDDVLARLANGSWQYYALAGRRVLSASGSAALSGDLAWAPLSQTVTVSQPAPDGTDSGSAGDTFRDCAECPLMARIPAGMFTMGSPESEFGRSSGESQRTVSIPAFAAGVYEVTFAQWDACAAAGGCGGYRPPDTAEWGRGDRPVINVNWTAAQWYVDWLSLTTGQSYRLLTESEWEYAARAGTTTPFHTGETITPQQANFNGKYVYRSDERNESGLARRQTVPVGSFAPNGFGLYDVHGNVWEWVQDCWGDYEDAPSDGSAAERDCIHRVVRGGGWANAPSDLRSADRRRVGTGDGYSNGGFRVARTL